MFDDFLSFLTSFQGRINGVELFACELRNIHTESVEWKGVKQINNITYTQNLTDQLQRSSTDIRVWQSYGIGVGKSYQWSDLDRIVTKINHLHVTDCKNVSSRWIIDSYKENGTFEL